MKKLLSIIFALILVLSLVSCSSKPKEIKQLEDLANALNKLSEEGADALDDIADAIDDLDLPDDYDYDTGNNSNYDTVDDVDFGEGNELSEFFTMYSNALDIFEGPISDWEPSDFFLLDAALDYMVPSMKVVDMSFYDSLFIFGKDEGEYKEVSGNIVKFGKDYIRAEDGYTSNEKQGDHVVVKAELDTSANTLVYETYIERDGELVAREVTEIVKLSDGTYMSQALSKTIPMDERLEDKGNAYFLVFNSKKLEVIKAKFEPNVNFSYSSIIGKSKLSVDEMAQGYTLIRKMTVDNGKVDLVTY